MDIFQLRRIYSLTYDEVIKHMPLATHLKLADAKEGRQPSSTYVIGCIKKGERINKISRLKDKLLKRFFVFEVCSDKEEGLRFQVSLYGEYGKAVEAALENITDECWLMFSDSEITLYRGDRTDVCRLCLKIESCTDNNNVCPKIAMFCHSSYVPLNKICVGKKHNIFAIVKEIIKATATLTNGNKHTMVALADPSCYEESPIRDDLPVHIFFNNPKENFPETPSVGDIFRIKEMLIEYYDKERTVYGKVWTVNAIVKFRVAEDAGEITPVTSNKNYVLTDEDKNIAKELYEFWSQKKREEENAEGTTHADEEDSFLEERQLCDINKEETPILFKIYCQVKEVRPVKEHNLVILRVTDGTRSNFYTRKISLDVATQELNTTTDYAVFGVYELDIAVFSQADTAAELQPNDFVELKHVTWTVVGNENETQSETSLPPLQFYDLHMTSEKCQIKKLSENNSRIRKLVRRLKNASEEEIEAGNEDLLLASSLKKDSAKERKLAEFKRPQIADDHTKSPSKPRHCKLDDAPLRSDSEVMETGSQPEEPQTKYSNRTKRLKVNDLCEISNTHFMDAKLDTLETEPMSSSFHRSDCTQIILETDDEDRSSESLETDIVPNSQSTSAIVNPLSYEKQLTNETVTTCSGVIPGSNEQLHSSSKFLYGLLGSQSVTMDVSIQESAKIARGSENISMQECSDNVQNEFRIIQAPQAEARLLNSQVTSGSNSQEGEDSSNLPCDISRALDIRDLSETPMYDACSEDIGTPMNEPSPNIGTPMNEPSPNIGTPVNKPSLNIGTPVNEPSPNIVTQVNESSPNIISPMNEPSPNIGTPANEPSPNIGTPENEPSPNFGTPVNEPSPNIVTQVNEPSPNIVTQVNEPSPNIVSPMNELSPNIVTPVNEPSPKNLSESTSKDEEIQSVPHAPKGINIVILSKASVNPYILKGDIRHTVSGLELNSLSSVAESCQMGDTWASWAVITCIFSKSEEPCADCKEDELCFHDFVWGYCSKCGNNMQSHLLRTKYSRETLIASTSLPCTACSSSEENRPETDNDNQQSVVERSCASSSSSTSDAQGGFTVHPFINLCLRLQDIVDGRKTYVDLSGDNAEIFFATKPSFSWTVSSYPSSFIEKILSVTRIERPLKLGFQCVVSDEEATAIHIYASELLAPFGSSWQSQ